MKKLLLILLLFVSVAALAQGEANNWYFGQFAGIRFNGDGTVTPLAGSAMATTEGCSSMSDALGNLLFYTDGRSVWDRNHVKMPNADYNGGTGMLGDPSSTQSAIIVPKKGDPNIYYIFTVDEPHHQNADVYPNQFTGTYFETNGPQFIPAADDGFNNGLNYSVVDLSVTGTNGSIGNVTLRNQHLLTYDPANPDEAKYKCSEKITAVKNANGSGFWVISQFLDKFYAFAVDATGVTTTPVVTQIDPMVTTAGYRRNSIGYLKASPDGQKLAVAHTQRSAVTGGAELNGAVYLYDFNDATGILSNPTIVKEDLSPYGIEFSPEAKKLYVCYALVNLGDIAGIRQYDLLAADIPSSEVMISASAGQGALQLGPNGKIYHAANGSQFLSVISAPEELGFLCDFQQFAQPVATSALSRATLGLPPFITSLFSATMLINNTCLGESTTFQLNVNKPFDTVSWNFGDGSAASTETTPTHTYAAAGVYNVVADVTRQGETTQVSMDVTITAIPTANTAPTLTDCDTGNDGFENFNLTVNTPVVLGAQDPALYDVKYYTSQDDADEDTNAVNAAIFTSTANPQTMYARVQNKLNPTCFATTSFQIRVASTPGLLATSFSTCDDAADGDDANGQATFNLDTVTQAVVQNSAQFTTKYYPTFAKALSQTDVLPVNFYNTTPNQQIVYARIANTAFGNCFRIQPVTLTVTPLPAAVTGATLVQCDLAASPDGFTQFNLSEADSQFTAGNANLTVAYFASATDVQTGTPLPISYTNTANPQQVIARLTDTQTGCSRLLPLNLIVNANTTTAIPLDQCDDDGTEDGLALFNLRDAGLEGGTNTVVYYASDEDALLEQNAILPDFTNTTPNQQSVYARIENNNACATLQEIKLIVRPLPDIDTTGEGLVCLNTGEYITLEPGLSVNSSNYKFIWSTGAETRTIQVNQPGVYTVRVIDRSSALECEKTRTITVTASDVAIITAVDIVDLTSGNNTVTVHAMPGNNVNTTYMYSLDLRDGPYQANNFFDNVTAGIHTVYVYDTQGCGVVHKDIAVLSIPKFFTPNNDGVNDTWNIVGVNALFYDTSKIYIFDRFGKLLANVDPRGQGWNGVYNGTPLPATDYWYVVQLDNGRIVKGHFSLLR